MRLSDLLNTVDDFANEIKKPRFKEVPILRKALVDMGELIQNNRWHTTLICHACGARFVEAEYVLCHLCADRAVGDDAFRAHTDKLREDKKLWHTLLESLVDFDPYTVARDHNTLDKIRPTIQTPGGIRAEREAALKQKQDLQAANQRKDVLNTLKATLKVQYSRSQARPLKTAEEIALSKLSRLPLIDVLKKTLAGILDDDQCKALSDHLTLCCSSKKTTWSAKRRSGKAYRHRPAQNARLQGHGLQPSPRAR
jgi:hypothetical protein